MPRKMILPQLLAILLAAACQTPPAEPPAPVGPLPSEAQLAWHDLQFYAFVHFNMNTFTNMEWGFGDESPTLFNPTELDARQWARVCKEAGMKGIIITAKHHDGFCLWPSAYTEHSVKNSPWRDGQGDLLRELSEACREYGLKFGVYLSPWDRNHADYGTQAYLTYFRNQLRELLTNYGEVYEVWFDGANGGTGYYGGANENRKIDNRTYYDWENTIKIVRELQPNAMIFSDAGPDIRWVGNEEGWANETNWAPLRRDEFYPGSPNYLELRSGHEDGTHWVPAECDVSIRPGWYYHPYEDHKVKSLQQLTDIYYHSIGRNANLLINLPVDRRGLVHERDVEQLTKLAETIRADFAEELARGRPITATNTRPGTKQYGPQRALDGDNDTYWATADSVLEASLEIDLPAATTFNRFLIQEHVPLGQRVTAFTLSAQQDDQWKTIAEATTIGYKRILRFEPQTTDKIKVEITARAPITISNIELYNAPALLADPTISRGADGKVVLAVADEQAEIYYTTDGSNPTPSSTRYEAPFELSAGGGTVKAVAYDPSNERSGDVITQKLGYARTNWRITAVSSGDLSAAQKAIDEDPNSSWQTDEKARGPQHIVIDLGETVELSSFSYLPMQGRWIAGFVQEYAFYTSNDGRNWQKQEEGEFSNILNNPIRQEVSFEPVSARYVKFEAKKMAADHRTMGIGDLGVAR
jgi:alpha-L-fucosidase